MDMLCLILSGNPVLPGLGCSPHPHPPHELDDYLTWVCEERCSRVHLIILVPSSSTHTRYPSAVSSRPCDLKTNVVVDLANKVVDGVDTLLPCFAALF